MTAAKITASAFAFQSLVRVPRPCASRVAHALCAMTPLDNSLSLAEPRARGQIAVRSSRESRRERLKKWELGMFREDGAQGKGLISDQ